ncbi:uncharacterized protein LOC103360188 [Stegastes partitus]|uniref:Uncharacterized protein LOC103360188 n=1 Tax=Stegastes partitus TaxID=144197 RepID=A0A9Y4JXH7_9TELE|nr:PREDICTED: uncharacterized protein LOC103360188 [Stegastes partitus]XP_008284090.1 PREDICTED: uncharacterized protein LOC103360188 [Stegastes partitus]
MPSLIMERRRQKQKHGLVDGFSTDLMNTGQFCFSCEQIFANRRCLEEHVCSSASFICSCGTEFTEYRDMLEHSTTHEPGHQVLDHETIRKRRIEKRREEEEQLKRLRKGEVVWKTPRSDIAPSVSLPMRPVLQVPNTSAHMSQGPMQSLQISQVPELHPSMSQASSLSNPVPLTTDMQDIFAGVGAPTVDLWTLYQPVVLIQTVRMFSRKKPYTCGKCGQGFMTKTSVISHQSSHVTDKISGCIGCGLLLSSKKLVPRFHVCNSRNNTTKLRLITAKPLNFKTLNIASADRRQNLSVHGPQVFSPLHLKNQIPNATRTGSHAAHITPSKQLKIQNIRPYNNSLGLHAASSFHLKNWSPSAVSSQRPVARMFSQGRPRLSVAPSVQLKTHTNSSLGGLSKPTQISPATKGFPCRVCRIAFETPQLLQRHKCIKAQEFMAQQVQGGKQHYKLKRMTPMMSPNPAQMNGQRKLGLPSSGSIRKNPIMAVGLDKGPSVVPVNGSTDVDIDNDCYIVESGPDKPAEMIYQVTSSVPIIT